MNLDGPQKEAIEMFRNLSSILALAALLASAACSNITGPSATHNSNKVDLAPPSDDPGQGSGGKENDPIRTLPHQGRRHGQQHTP